MDLVCVDPWSAGSYAPETLADGCDKDKYSDQQEHKGLRLSRSLVWVRNSPTDNLYSHPVDGLTVLVDLDAMKVLRVDDYQVIPVPKAEQNYSHNYMQNNYRSGLKPLSIVQPDGPSFTVEGHSIEWQRWSFRIGFNAREGLVLHQVGYEDPEKGCVRPIIYRASLVEMTVPYGDTSLSQARKNAFDLGEYGLGCMANSLTLGCDCLGVIKYFDAVLSHTDGTAWVIPNAICLHEEDYGMLWKHTDWRTEEVSMRC